jgi:septal ring-binding cell division protein DamX
MKTGTKIFAMIGAVLTAAVAITQLSHADYSVGQIVEKYRVAKAANTYVIEPKDVKDKPFTIQVASHINEKEAIEHVEQLRVQEENVFYYPNFVKSQVFFKVCVGRFETKEAAEAYRADFVRRMDEPFAVSISLMDRPGEDKKATKAQVASSKKTGDRMVASVDAGAPPIDLKNEGKAQHSPATGAEAPKADLDVKLHKKSNPVVAAVNAGFETASKSYSLQVAAYPTEALAKAESAKVKAAGQEVYYKSTDVNGKTWYRVYVGKFKSFSEAQAYQSVYAETTPGMTIIRKFAR